MAISNIYFDQIKSKNSKVFSNTQEHTEAKDYFGLEFNYNNQLYVQRTAKITPTKIGQFVTLWIRNKEGVTEPYSDKSNIDFVIIICEFKDRVGCFVFPKQVLIDRGIISSKKFPGKRGFRVYPSWDIPTSKQAIATQKWQLDYFRDDLMLCL